MSNAEPLVVIAVLNWNGAPSTINCVRSLKQMDYRNTHIIVVDNASTDDSVRHICEELPDVTLILSETNNGYAAGNELVLPRAFEENADLFWIINNDCLPSPNALSKLVDAYREHGDTMIYGSVPVYEADGLRVGLRVLGIDRNGNPDFSSRRFVGQRYDVCFSDPANVRVANVSGASMLVPIEVIRKHGFMDTSFFLYAEDTDYCLRLRKKGVEALLVPGSIVVHQPYGAHKNHPGLKPVILYYQIRTRLELLRRHGSKATFFRAVLSHMGYGLLRPLISLVQNQPVVLSTVFVWRGLYDALRGKTGKTYAPEDYLPKTTLPEDGR